MTSPPKEGTGNREQGTGRNNSTIGSGASSLKMWIKKPNPPTPFPAREGGEAPLSKAGEELGERSSRWLAPNPQF
ncbi:MAG: hypothetical protein F6K24_03170 [Okeania sp. SIO2D1]|nr:hypothetical protein [Okeania sp. SIO2D1]